jgi:hypothetical protein
MSKINGVVVDGSLTHFGVFVQAIFFVIAFILIEALAKNEFL